MEVFQPFPKLARLARECVVTEKLDGTNAQVIIVNPDNSEPALYEETQNVTPLAIFGELYVYAGSRTRLITPGKQTDNYGFAAWVQDNAEQVVQLGEGRHYGEWYGRGIQRGYGLTDRRFALFDTERWAGPSRFPFHPYLEEDLGKPHPPAGIERVAQLYRGPFDTNKIKHALGLLRAEGSRMVPGWYDPEGIVVYHSHARVAFKMTYDDKHKDAA